MFHGLGFGASFNKADRIDRLDGARTGREGEEKERGEVLFRGCPGLGRSFVQFRE
jgi:hypothetical protein